MKESEQKKAAAEAQLRQLLAAATQPDRDLARRLLVARQESFGRGVICVGGVMIAIAAFFRSTHPQDTAVILLLALVTMLIGAYHLDHWNRQCRKLAQKMLKRLKHGPPDDAH